MKLPLVSLHDRKTNLFDRPTLCRHTAEAVRDFNVLRSEPGNRISKNPEDFSLVHVGHFDDETGEFSNLAPQEVLIQGSLNA